MKFKFLFKRFMNFFYNYFMYYGFKIFYPKGSHTASGVIRNGTYEKDNLLLLFKYVTDNSVYFDLGGNIGLMSVPILAAKRKVTVFTYEASPITFFYLNKTLLRNKISTDNQWVIKNLAISNSSGKVLLNVSKNTGGTYDSMGNTRRVDWDSTIEVDSVTLDQEWASIGKPQVDFIKSDLEGADLLALEGGIDCIRACKPKILFEWQPLNFHAFNLSHTDLLVFMEKANYTLYAVPNLFEILNETDLNLATVFTESFLLVSKSDN